MKDIKNENILRVFIKFVSLNVVSMIGLSFYILADTYFIANGVGSDGLAALNLAIPIFGFINAAAIMIGIGGATRYSILHSEFKVNEANEAFTHSLFLGFVFGFLFLLLGVFFSGALSYIFGVNEHTFYMTETYLKTVLCFGPIFVLNSIMICFIRNDKSPKLSMFAMLTGSFSNIILDYTLIFPLKMGIFGAALATAVAPIISLIILSSHFIRHKNGFKPIRCKINLYYIKDIIFLGISSFVTEMSSGIVIIVFNIVILTIAGNYGVAAYGIIANLAIVAVSIFTGIAQGIQPIVSSNYGRKNKINVNKTLRYALITSFIFAILIYLVSFTFSDNIVAMFNKDNDKALSFLASNGLRLYFIAFIFLGFNVITASFFSSVELPLYSSIISMTRGFIFIIPLVFILSRLFSINGTWLSFSICEVLTFMISNAFLIRYMKKDKSA